MDQRGQAPKRPKLDPYTGIIDQILEDDKSESKKQRHGIVTLERGFS